jgi:hypothetical protein
VQERLRKHKRHLQDEFPQSGNKFGHATCGRLLPNPLCHHEAASLYKKNRFTRSRAFKVRAAPQPLPPVTFYTPSRALNLFHGRVQ